MTELQSKEKVLEEYLRDLGSAVVAFSSGVDSTFLLKKAKDVLGRNVIAVTESSCIFPGRELDEAKAFCEKENIKHIIIDTDELSIEGFADNPKNRCYICKKKLFETIKEVAKENGIEEVIEGSNMDDMGDYRPGLKAVEELGIKSPLRYAGLYKNEIRQLSKELGLATFSKPSFACLASRFVYGEKITKEKLSMIEKAESMLLSMGVTQVRVRLHGNLARIEVNESDIERLAKQENREQILKAFKKYGFSYVTLDLAGYKMGSMNNFD